MKRKQTTRLDHSCMSVPEKRALQASPSELREIFQCALNIDVEITELVSVLNVIEDLFGHSPELLGSTVRDIAKNARQPYALTAVYDLSPDEGRECYE